METTKTINERIVARHELAGATIRIMDGMVTTIRLVLYNRRTAHWEDHSVNSVAQLRGMQTALGEVLAELQERGLVPDEE